MKTRNRSAKSLRLKVLSAAVASCFAAEAALANPTGANVVHGTAAIHQAGNLLQITNSPSAIINWQSFSIGAGEITRFLQQSSSSAVLNRVTTQNNPSQILGSLQSRLLDGVTTGGRVFLINPNGILFGAGAQIDVGGLVASTLNMSNEDFLAGRMRFTDGLGNSIVNQGSINTPAGGHVYLVGPAVKNEGIITSLQGEVVLAAGNTVELVNPGTPNLRVEITAPDNQALNLGQIFADSGRVGIYAGLINQSGVVQANTAVATEDGRIVLKATNSAILGPGSLTLASGPVAIEAADVTVSGTLATGPLAINAAGNIGVIADGGRAEIASNGPQDLRAGGGLVIRSEAGGAARVFNSGGQSIDAGFVEIKSMGAGSSGVASDSQTINVMGDITVAGIGGSSDLTATTQRLSAGGGLIVRSEAGGFAQLLAFGEQSISAGSVDVHAASAGLTHVSNFGGVPFGTQTIVAAGDITIAAAGAGASINSHGAQHITGNRLLMQSGPSSGLGLSAGSEQSIDAASGIVLAANGGSINVSSSGSQNVRTGGGLVLRGEAGGGAGLNAVGAQTVGAAFIEVSGTGGSAGIHNFDPLVSSPQTISASGDITIVAANGNAIISSGGLQSLGAGGGLFVQSNPGGSTQVTSTGGQSITAGEGLIVQSSAAGPAQLLASGGQTINAGFVEVTAQDAPAMISNNFSGAQVITTSGMNAAGEGLAVRNLGGASALARIGEDVVGGTQLISVNNADRVTVDSPGAGVAGIFGFNGTQTLSVTGAGANALTLGSPGSLGASQIGGGGSQTVTAGLAGEAGSITIVGRAAGAGGSSIIVSNPVVGGTQNVSTSGTLTVIGGTAPTGAAAGVFANGIGGQQTVNADAIFLQGGAGGSGNSAHIGANNGSQQVTVGTGGITIIGGADGTNNNAQLRQSVPTGSQTISVNGGDIALQGGAGGTNNGSFLFGANQDISVTGNVTITGGASTGNSAILGGPNNVETNLLLSAGGDIVLKGGSAATTGASIGTSGGAPLQPTNMVINAGRSIILNSGLGSGARIGSSTTVPAAGGDISVNAGGDIQLNGTTQATLVRTLGNVTLNAGGAISEASNGRIEAAALATSSGTGASLTGPNQVAGFNATNTGTGDIALVNSGNLAATASNSAPSGKITITNLAGNLSTSGAISASGGGSANVALSAPGAINIAHAVTASGAGNVSLAGGAITVDDTSVTAGGSVAVNGASLDVKGVSSGALIEAGNGFDANLSGDLRVHATSTGGGLGGWSAILAGSGPVNISAGNVALEGGSKLGSFSTIAGESVAINTTGDLSIAGGTGFGAFGLLSSYRDINLTVGGTVRLDSGSGLGSFARVQTLYPGSTINIDFPNLGSGGYFVNDIEGRISQGLSGFFNGIRPARLGKSLIVTYGE